MGEPGMCIRERNRLQRLLESCFERIAGEGLDLVQGGFDFRPALLNRVEVRGI